MRAVMGVQRQALSGVGAGMDQQEGGRPCGQEHLHCKLLEGFGAGTMT